VDIPTKFHEIWWKESNFFSNLPLLNDHSSLLATQKLMKLNRNNIHI
jgi:hypothetical protein